MKRKKPKVNDHPRTESGKGSRKWQIISGTIVIVIGVIGWYLRGCLDEQKAGLREAREAWVSVRETSQRYIDDRVALNEQLSLFYERQLQDNPDAEWIEARKKELITLTETDENVCNAAKNARYDFAGKLRRACQSFVAPCPTDLAPVALIEQMCGTASKAAAVLRSANAANIAKTPIRLKIAPYSKALATIEQENRTLDDTRAAERDHDRGVDEFFSQIERQDTWMHVWSCVRATGGS